MHFRKIHWRCITAVGCVKKRHAPRCIHKMQAILSVYGRTFGDTPCIVLAYKIHVWRPNWITFNVVLTVNSASYMPCKSNVFVCMQACVCMGVCACSVAWQFLHDASTIHCAHHLELTLADQITNHRINVWVALNHIELVLTCRNVIKWTE